MGSVGFDGEVQFQPSTHHCNKYKLPRKQLLVVGCGAVRDASVPRKLRSAMKKRTRETITSPLSISKKQFRVSNRVDTLKKDGVKKSKTKRGHITKDEEEVAETLYALSNMFSYTNKANQQKLNNVPNDMKSSSSMNAVEDNVIRKRREESKKISSEVTFEVNCHSPNLSDSKQQFLKLQCSNGAQKPDWSSNKLSSSSPGGSGVESDLHLLRRPRVSTEHAFDLEQGTASVAQYGKKYYHMNDKCNGLFQSPTGTESSETQRSCIRLPAWFQSTNLVSQPPVFENHIITDTHTRVAVQSKKSWKRCLAHVNISRLIKVLQVSERKEGSPEKPAQVTTSRGAHLVTGINGRQRGVSCNGIINSDKFFHKRLIQDETSTIVSGKEGYDFLCGWDATRGKSRAGYAHEAPKQFNASYVQSQNHTNVLFSLLENGYSSTSNGHNLALAAQKIQLPQYHSTTINSSFAARMERHLEMQQQHKWADQLRAQYSIERPDRKNGKTNCAQALFPNLLNSKYQQQFSLPKQNHHISSIDSSLPLQNHYREFSLGFERNGAAFYSENIKQQLQLPCNQNL